MTVIAEFLDLRNEVLEASKGQDGFIDEQGVLGETLPLMLDAKLVDSEDFNEAYIILEEDQDLKLNGYAVNETGERLQLFAVDEAFVNEGLESDELLISERTQYERQFRRVTRFIRSAIDGSILAKLQDADPLKALAVQLASPQGIEQFDVIEVFLVTLTGTVSRKGQELQPRNIHFDQDTLKVSQKVDGVTKRHGILLLRRVIDLNFIHAINVSRGNREPLEIDFQRDFNTRIEVIQAAGGSNFESYLCVLSADVLSDLYRLHSSRLLEKNVRSFLQFRGANKGIRDTIRENPEKFIAYNNGLTITATEARVTTHKRKTYIESLTDFQIVNGGQTTASIYFSKKDGLDVSGISVMAKINVVKGNDENELDDLISNISRFSNTQSRVSDVDLRSRNPQLRQLKTLSNSVTTPSGEKWFFERAKGEFNTSLRLAGGQKASQQKKFPPARRFSKEQLAKYHTSWGNIPYAVKKGGEKVFRHFIEIISQEEDAPLVAVDRDFYEELIAKIILFRQMEKLYGQGKNAIGQIRSAAVPYAISCLYEMSDGAKEGLRFDLGKIWRNEGIEDDLQEYLRDLLQLMNNLIKKYSLSDDLGEYSKRPELWNAIRNSKELKAFIHSADSTKVKGKYLIQADEMAQPVLSDKQ
jgi:hypothetical protein